MTHVFPSLPPFLPPSLQVYQKYIVERFTAQKTDYQELLQVGREGGRAGGRVGEGGSV